VRRLPAQPEVAAQARDRERAELRRLLERLADGDRSAFRSAFALLWPRIRAFAVRYAGVDGEDAAQQARLRVFSRASEYDGERDALAWALGIAAWECRTLRRKRERRKEEAIAVPEQVDRGATPEQAAMDGELRAAATEVLGTLRPIDLETISALVAGTRPPGATFRKRMQRAISRFRAAWRARHGGE
jgi:RNA polymerase sigma-70 factor (ECF subfamily)